MLIFPLKIPRMCYYMGQLASEGATLRIRLCARKGNLDCQSLLSDLGEDGWGEPARPSSDLKEVCSPSDQDW